MEHLTYRSIIHRLSCLVLTQALYSSLIHSINESSAIQQDTVVAGGNGLGNNDTQLYNPYGLVYDSVSRSFIIPNYGAHNIVRWVLGASNRTVIAGDLQGNFGSNSTLLRSPVGIKMDPMGNIYVADSGNHRIQLFMAGQSNGITIAGNGIAGTSASQLNSPFWLLLDNQLNLYVSDTVNNRMQKFLRY